MRMYPSRPAKTRARAHLPLALFALALALPPLPSPAPRLPPRFPRRATVSFACPTRTAAQLTTPATLTILAVSIPAAAQASAPETIASEGSAQETVAAPEMDGASAAQDGASMPQVRPAQCSLGQVQGGLPSTGPLLSTELTSESAEGRDDGEGDDGEGEDEGEGDDNEEEEDDDGAKRQKRS